MLLATVGVNSNGAIVHYRAVPSSAKTLGPHDMILLDSGGQYLDGTTDVTRTFHTGDPKNERTSETKRRIDRIIVFTQTYQYIQSYTTTL